MSIAERASTSTKPALRASSDEAVPVEPEVVDPLGLGAVEGAVLAVEIRQRQPAARHQHAADRRQGGGRVLDVVEHEERHGEVERLRRWWVCHEVELDGADLRQVGGRQLLADDRQHPVRRLGEDELTDVVEQRQAEETGPGPDVDDAVGRRERDVGADRVGRLARASDPLRRVPVLRSLVERRHMAMMPHRLRWPHAAPRRGARGRRCRDHPGRARRQEPRRR